MTFDELNSRLNETSIRRDALLRARARFTALETDLAAARSRREALASAMAQEQIDVERLEGKSLQALFYSVLGSREQQLEKERQEYLAARLRYDEAGARIRKLEADRDALLEEARKWAGADTEYDQLLAEKERLILAAGDDAARRLQAANDRLRGLASELRETEEAERAGTPALQALRDVERSLGKAAGWGTWDMLGGGTLATWGKHENIDDARAALYRAQHYLQLFANELSDLGQAVSWQLDLGGLTTFADYFFDNLITDWVVQQRINRSLEATRELGRKVEQLVYNLGRRRQRLLQDEAHCRLEREALLAR